MAKKLKVDVDYFEDYSMLSLATQMKDYKLAFHINRVLDINLKKFADLSVSGRKGAFPWFYHSEGKNHPTFYLIGNNHPEGKIITAQKGIDYFLLIKELYSDELLGQYVSLLRKIPGILGVFITNMSAVKNLEVLIESVELHELETVLRPTKRVYTR
jgi:hypothetical protein